MIEMVAAMDGPPIRFKELYPMFINKIWDRQTDSQTVPYIELLFNSKVGS